VLLYQVIQSFPDVSPRLQVLYVSHQPGALAAFGQPQGVFGGVVEVVVAVAGDVNLEFCQQMGHLFSSERAGQFGGSKRISGKDEKRLWVLLAHGLDLFVEVEEAELS
jgi:hypothetical protein